MKSLQIFQFGNVVQLRPNICVNTILSDLENFPEDWSQYNEFKPDNRRQGLCILNESGINQSGPALSSLLEWNAKYGTEWEESDFVVPTPVYAHSKALQDLLPPILPYIRRAHFLKIQPGGYFPPHRDTRRADPDTFRLLIALDNCHAPYFRFMMGNETINFVPGDMYAVNTTLEHSLFNMNERDAHWIVINAQCCDEMIDFVRFNLTI
jgi:hypothetical protein